MGYQESLSKPPTRCRRCGTCCLKGGPALHIQDRPLVESGRIPLSALFTIRRSEPTYDNIRNLLVPAATDFIKIKAITAHTTACRFLALDPSACLIYESRPVECRLLNCRDTRAIIAIYDQHRLTREALLGHLTDWSELVADHQHHCDCERVAHLAEAIRKGGDGTEAGEALLDMLHYDQSLRQVSVERTRLNPDLLDFLFGRPLVTLLPAFHLKLVYHGSQPSVMAAL